MLALTLSADGAVAQWTFTDAADIEAFVDGSIEELPLEGSLVLLFNDDGLMRGLTHNAVATALVRGLGAGYSEDDTIAGDAVIVSRTDDAFRDVDDSASALLERLGLPTP